MKTIPEMVTALDSYWTLDFDFGTNTGHTIYEFFRFTIGENLSLQHEPIYNELKNSNASTKIRVEHTH